MSIELLLLFDVVIRDLHWAQIEVCYHINILSWITIALYNTRCMLDPYGIINNYLPMHVEVIIGEYSPIITETEVNNCFI